MASVNRTGIADTTSAQPAFCTGTSTSSMARNHHRLRQPVLSPDAPRPRVRAPVFADAAAEIAAGLTVKVEVEDPAFAGDEPHPPHAAAPTDWVQWASEMGPYVAGLAAMISNLLAENQRLQGDNNTMNARLSAAEAAAGCVNALRGEVQELRAELQQHREREAANTPAPQLADMQQQMTTLQRSVADIQQHSAAVRSWASVVAGAPPATPWPPAPAPCTPAQTPCTMHFRLVPRTSTAPEQLPTSDEAARQVAREVMHGITAQSVRLLPPKPGHPAAIMVEVPVCEARTLRAKLWETLGQEQQRRCGWRISVYLPQEEFVSKQSLWARFGERLTAAVRAGKRLIYSQRHQAVRVDGEAEVMCLSAAAAA